MNIQRTETDGLHIIWEGPEEIPAVYLACKDMVESVPGFRGHPRQRELNAIFIQAFAVTRAQRESYLYETDGNVALLALTAVGHWVERVERLSQLTRRPDIYNQAAYARATTLLPEIQQVPEYEGLPIDMASAPRRFSWLRSVLAGGE